MIRTYRAEWARLIRRRVLLASALAVLAAGFGGAAVVLSGAKPAAEIPLKGYTPSLQSLASSGGGTEIFRFAAAYWGTGVFVLFVALFALEFSRGTYRTMLLRQPGRIRLLGGKLAAMLSFAAAVLACTEAVTWIAARLEAPAKHIPTHAWVSVDAFGSAVADFGTVLVWVVGYAVFGLMVAVLFRSVPLALAVGIAWAGPIEHLVQNAWAPAQRIFPGLLLEVVGQHGTPEVSFTRALVMVAFYTVAFAAITSVVFGRRDVTA